MVYETHEERGKFEQMEVPEFLRAGGEDRKIKNYKYFNRGVYSTPSHFDVKFEVKYENKKRTLNRKN